MQKPRIQRAVAPPLPCIRSSSSCRSEVVTGLALPHPRAAWQPLGEAQVKDLDPSLQSTPKASGFCQCQLSPPGQAMPQGIRSTLGCQEQGWARGGWGCQQSVGLTTWGKPLIVQEADGRKGWTRPLSQVEGRGIDVGTPDFTRGPGWEVRWEGREQI